MLYCKSKRLLSAQHSSGTAARGHESSIGFSTAVGSNMPTTLLYSPSALSLTGSDLVVQYGTGTLEPMDLANVPLEAARGVLEWAYSNALNIPWRTLSEQVHRSSPRFDRDSDWLCFISSLSKPTCLAPPYLDRFQEYRTCSW